MPAYSQMKATDVLRYTFLKEYNKIPKTRRHEVIKLLGYKTSATLFNKNYIKAEELAVIVGYIKNNDFVSENYLGSMAPFDPIMIWKYCCELLKYMDTIEYKSLNQHTQRKIFYEYQTQYKRIK